jgi:hypothetical protein
MGWQKICVVAAGSAFALAAMAGPAAAHECFNASRSAQGNASAGAHSAAWHEFSLDTVLTQFIGVDQPTADCVEAHAADFGLPSSFVFGDKQAVGQDGVIAEHNPNLTTKGLGSNGKGIDHGEEVYGEALFAAIGSCSPTPAA